MTPSGELREAAALLRARAGKATPGPWEAGELWEITGNSDRVQTVTAVGEHHQHIDVAGYRVQTEDYGDDGGITPGDAEWIALVDPPIAEPLAAWLTQAADELDNWGSPSWVTASALRVARSITKAQEA